MIIIYKEKNLDREDGSVPIRRNPIRRNANCKFLTLTLNPNFGESGRHREDMRHWTPGPAWWAEKSRTKRNNLQLVRYCTIDVMRS